MSRENVIKWRKSSLEVQNGGYFSIGEVSRLLEVPAATIRFWEQEGLISPCKGANRYRAYGPRELAEIADVIFLRSSGVPVKDPSAPPL